MLTRRGSNHQHVPRFRIILTAVGSYDRRIQSALNIQGRKMRAGRSSS